MMSWLRVTSTWFCKGENEYLDCLRIACRHYRRVRRYILALILADRLNDVHPEQAKLVKEHVP